LGRFLTPSLPKPKFMVGFEGFKPNYWIQEFVFQVGLSVLSSLGGLSFNKLIS